MSDLVKPFKGRKGRLQLEHRLGTGDVDELLVAAENAARALSELPASAAAPTPATPTDDPPPVPQPRPTRSKTPPAKVAQPPAEQPPEPTRRRRM